MLDWLFGKKYKEQLGIDLGGSAIKIVELTKKNERLSLTNYAFMQFKEEAVFKFGDLKDEEVASLLSALISEAKIESRHANISLPVGKTFSTIIDFPPMSKTELEAAIPFEAKKYIPVPLDEVVLDWSVIGETGTPEKSQKENIDVKPKEENNKNHYPKLQVLLIAVPREIINRLSRIAKLANLDILALEQESFSLVRSLIGNDKGTFLIIDVGRGSSDIIVVDQGFVLLSHNLQSARKEVLVIEVDRLVNIFRKKYNKNIKQCLLTGGGAREEGIEDFFSDKLKLEIRISNPFARIVCLPELNSVMPEIASRLSVAVGLAMRE